MYLGIKDSILREKGGYYAALEIERQKELWTEAIDILTAHKDEITGYISRIKQVDNLRVVITGAGSSGLAGKITAKHISKCLNKKVEFILSTDIVTDPDFHLNNVENLLLISLSSSGSTPETVHAVELATQRAARLYQVVIVCVPEGILASKLSKSPDNLHIKLPANTKGKSFAATAEFTLLVQYAAVIFDITNLKLYKKIFDETLFLATRFFTDKMDIIREIAAAKYENIIFLGSNELGALAEEGALKIVEFSNGLQGASFHTSLEFRHGPKLILNSKTLCVIFISNDTYVQKYDLDMLKELFTDDNKATILSISDSYIPEAAGNSAVSIHFNQSRRDYINDLTTSFLYALAMQTLAFSKSLAIGVTPDLPDHEGKVPKIVNKVTIYNK